MEDIILTAKSCATRDWRKLIGSLCLISREVTLGFSESNLWLMARDSFHLMHVRFMSQHYYCKASSVRTVDAVALWNMLPDAEVELELSIRGDSADTLKVTVHSKDGGCCKALPLLEGTAFSFPSSSFNRCCIMSTESFRSALRQLPRSHAISLECSDDKLVLYAEGTMVVQCATRSPIAVVDDSRGTECSGFSAEELPMALLVNDTSVINSYSSDHLKQFVLSLIGEFVEVYVKNDHPLVLKCRTPANELICVCAPWIGD